MSDSGKSITCPAGSLEYSKPFSTRIAPTGTTALESVTAGRSVAMVALAGGALAGACAEADATAASATVESSATRQANEKSVTAMPVSAVYHSAAPV